VVQLTGEPKTKAITQAHRDRLARLRRERRLADDLAEVATHCARLPVLDARAPGQQKKKMPAGRQVPGKSTGFEEPPKSAGEARRGLFREKAAKP
jgi:hypothetical protein